MKKEKNTLKLCGNNLQLQFSSEKKVKTSTLFMSSLLNDFQNSYLDSR